jgi:hypothetical protein
MTKTAAKRFSRLQTLAGMSILRGEFCTAEKQIAEMEELAPAGDNYHTACVRMARAALAAA